jgi:hypothetical protein
MAQQTKYYCVYAGIEEKPRMNSIVFCKEVLLVETLR